MFKVCVYLLIVAAAVSAYDFKDSDYNQYLYEEVLDDLEDAFDGSVRNRRDAEIATTKSKDKECSRREWKKECCAGDKAEREQLDQYKEAAKQCLTELRGSDAEEAFDPFDCEKMQKVKEEMTCVKECVMKKFKTVDEQGEFKRDAILEQLRTKLGQTAWKKEALEGLVDKCLAEVKEKKSVKTEIKGCNRSSLDLHHCLWREFSLACPADLRVDSAKCKKVRERLATGDTAVLNKHFLHHYLHSQKQEE